MSKFKVGFVGLGLMGLPMTKNILKKKYPLIVWNRSTKNYKKIKKLGAKICRNLIDLPDQCHIIIMMLVNDAASIKVSDVLNKILTNEDFRENLVQKGTEFINKYLINQGNSSEFLANFLHRSK